MAARRHEAAADEYDRRQPKQPRQLPDGIENDHVGGRFHVRVEAAAPRDREPLVRCDRRRLGEPFRVSRGDNQQCVRERSSGAGERAQHRLLFTAQRARGDEYTPASRELERPQDRVPVAGRGSGIVRRVELEAAGDGQPVRRQAERDKAPAPELVLRADTVDAAQRAPHEPADQPVAAVRAVGDAAVHDHRPDAAAAAGAQQVRPDLRVDQHEQLRRDAIERAGYAGWEIQRRIESGVDSRHQLPRHELARGGGSGDDQPVCGVGCLQQRNERLRRQHLAHRYGVNPDRRAAVRVDRRRRPAEAVPDPPQWLAVPPGAISDDRHARHEVHAKRKVVEQVHGHARPRRVEAQKAIVGDAPPSRPTRRRSD